MDKPKEERRRYERFDTDIKIYFQVKYDIKTIVKFQVVDKDKESVSTEKYSALSKNISAEGLCFTSEKWLQRGDILHLEVYLPDQKDPIYMEGETRWCQLAVGSETNEKKFDTGIKLVLVNGKSVTESINFDQANKIVWSVVLDSIFGNFRKFAEKLRNTK